MKPCKFTFDDEKVYDGFAHGSTWNGFDNVAVTKETLDKIVADFWPLALARTRRYRFARSNRWPMVSTRSGGASPLRSSAAKWNGLPDG